MFGTSNKDISRFFAAGINYRKTDAEIRSRFAISQEKYEELLFDAPQFGIKEFFILSTCNRTEIFGFANNADHLIHFLCSRTSGSEETFRKLAYVKNGEECVEHLFNVAAGLDSQILGDYEIVGQIKKAILLSKQYGFTGAFLDRLVNAALRASKTIKNQTLLSGGTVSVSFAAVQYIREYITDIAGKNILLLGVGKIGRNTSRNLVDYLNTKNITLINRSPEKAQKLATELGLKYLQAELMNEAIAEADIILTSTNSTNPLIHRSHLENNRQKLIIDLSVPFNVDEDVKELSNIKLVNVDELSKLKDATLQKREAEVPKAKAIIFEQLNEFLDWYEMRKYVPVLKAVKTKLKEINTSPIYINQSQFDSFKENNTDKKIQQIIDGLAVKMRNRNQQGCYYIEAINEFIATGSD